MIEFFGLFFLNWWSGHELTRTSYYQQLAQHHAPIVIQFVGRNPKGDAITRFDFDGDWVGNNNWDHLDKFPTPAWVYYNVIETKTHLFLSYSFFHPRDYSKLCVWWFCHENDLEGVIFTVEKDGSRFGKIVQVEALAHNGLEASRDPRRLEVERLWPNQNGQVVLEVEYGGHGVYPWRGEWGDKQLVYHFGNKAEDPAGVENGRFSYQLIPLAHLWIRRDEVGKGRVYLSNYEHVGKRFSIGQIPLGFAGEKWGEGRANPPWAWIDTSDDRMARGDWFLDPAFSAFRDWGADRPSISEYLFNAFLGVGDPR